MKRFILLFFLFPFSLSAQVAQECTTITSVINADSIVICVDSVSCNAICDGRIEIDVYPQNNLYNYTWDSVAVAGLNVRDSLCAGTYGVTITDANGIFVFYQEIFVDEPSAISIFSTITDPTCNNYSDGSIDIVTNGGSPSYSYLWSNGFNSPNLDSISSGSYWRETTDQNNCKDTIYFTVNNPLAVTSITTNDTLSCIGSCDAEVSVFASNGFSPYIYQWNGVSSQTNDTAIGLCYGPYTVFITDGNGCFDTNTVFVENPDTLKLEIIEIDSACFDIWEGGLLISIEGGTSPYNINWSIGDSIFDTINTTVSNLCPDIYEITFSDANGCSEIQQIILTERDSFRILASVINDSCFNSCTGEIRALVLNRNSPPFIYNWSNGDQDSVASNLCKDSLNVEIVDARGCVDTFHYFINEPDVLSFDSVLIVHNICYGEENGSITVNLSGGTGIISTIWSNGDTTEDISNLLSGSYSLYIEDQNLCYKDTIIQVGQPDILKGVNSVQDASCKFYSDGIIDVLIQGGTNPYTISWDVIIEDTTYIDSLAAGQYIYTIIDTNGCEAIDTITVSEPGELISIDSITDVLCHGDSTGAISLTITGGTPGYSYVWTPNFPSATNLIHGLASGVYIVDITDQKGCLLQESYNITEPQFSITSNMVGTNILCNSSSTGSIDLTVNGGTSPYTYLWNTADTTEDIDTLEAGLYDVTIIDGNGCDTNVTFTITEPTPISWSPILSNLLCFNDNTGSINLTVTGGTPGYIFSWAGPNGYTETTEDIHTLEAGSYTITVTDNNLCETDTTFSITEPLELIASILTNHVTCFGDDNGSIDLTVTGGTVFTGSFNYLYNWSNGMSNEDINSLSSGIYTVTVTDANSCSVTLNDTITSPEPITFIPSTIINSACQGEALGSIDIDVFGGVGGFSYLWSPNGATTQDIDSLLSGNYTVMVTDGNGCSMSDTYFIDEASAIFSSAIITHILGCYGDNTGSIDLQLIGGNPPYNYDWDNGASTQLISNLFAGDYQVIIRDYNNCMKEFSYTLTQPTSLSLDYTVIKASCEENNDGAIYTNVSGGTMPYSYQWSNGEVSRDLLNLSNGVYSLYVEDISGCSLPLETFNIGFDGFDGCIEIPTGFTPNGDGIHDEWSIYGLYYFPDVLVKIFNRWGQKLFESNGYNIPWDGKYNGKDLPIATYYYIIELQDSEKIFNGTVTIKR